MKILQVGLEKAINWLERDLYMGYLDENEWILLNEIAYNISYIFTVEDVALQTSCEKFSYNLQKRNGA